MRATLWHRGFLATMALFSLVFYLCVFVLSASSFSALLTTEERAADGEEYAVRTAMAASFQTLGESRPNRVAAAAAFARFYGNRGVRLGVFAADGQLFSNLPRGIPPETGERKATLGWERTEDGVYLVIRDTLPTGEWLVTAKAMDAVLTGFLRRTLLLLLLATISVLLLCGGLYYTLRRVNRPVDNLAHELRTPLTTIRGYAEFLQTAAASEAERYEAAQYIIDESGRLAAVAERLLAAASLRDGSVRKERVNLAELLAHVQKTYPAMTYTCAIPSLSGDPALLTSLVGNLVHNAVKAGPPGAAVTVCAGAGRITVSDAGRGMTAEALERANRPAAPALGGSGRGIPLCHDIAALHGARLRFTQNEKGGVDATIDFTTP